MKEMGMQSNRSIKKIKKSLQRNLSNLKKERESLMSQSNQNQLTKVWSLRQREKAKRKEKEKKE
jgi:sugar-specific transcriptional regulator TrmB